MKNLKIRVANKAESKEAQELLDILGYSKDAFENKSTPCWIAICDGLTYSDYNIGKNIWYTACPKEITIQELRDMVNPMKEYLVKTDSGSYLHTKNVSDIDAERVIEVPEGATHYAIDSNLGITKNYFFRCPNDAIWVDSQWMKANFSVANQTVLWQRHTQPEELPFLDSPPEFEHGFGASSLNDQYAEIEQVRQSGMKFDSNKPRHSLLPKGAVNSVIKVLEFGAKKYDADNWQKVDNAEERYYNAAMRHIDSWWNGEKCDPETGSHHLAHAATNLFFLMWFDNK